MTLITLLFAPEMEDAILAGTNCCTSRKNKKGEVGDLFVVKDRLYRIVHVHHCLLYSVRDAYYDAEGFAYPGDFQEFWITHIGKFDPGQIVYLHFFAYVITIIGENGCSSCPCIEYLNEEHTRFRCQIPGVRMTEYDITGCPGDL